MVKSCAAEKRQGMLIKENFGITLIALVVTIIVLLILAGVTIATLTGNNGIVKNATEAQIRTELANVDEALETYKLKKEMQNIKSSSEITDEDLIGIVFKKIYINDTYREIGIIYNLKEIGIQGKLGKNGANIKEETKSTLLDLQDVYAIDFSDGTLYYINNGIWSIEGIKKEYEMGKGEQFEIETVNPEGREKQKFITTWKVEQAGEIILPIYLVSDYNSTSDYNCIIEVEDESKSIIQEIQIKATQGINETQKSIEELRKIQIAIPGIYKIKIRGICDHFSFADVGTSKLQMININHWGNVKFEKINFSGCENLEGEIPPTNEETFSLAKGDNLSELFYNCKKLTQIPDNLLVSAKNITSLTQGFRGCEKLRYLPKDLFKECKELNSLFATFYGCTSLPSIPSDFFVHNAKLKSFGSVWNGAFEYCTSLKQIPEDLFNNQLSLTEVRSVFRGCSSLVEIPANLFSKNKKITVFEATFQDCTQLTAIPENLFAQNTEVTMIRQIFMNCSNIEQIPERLFARNTKVQDFTNCFKQCTKIQQIPGNLLENCSVLINVTEMFRNTGIQTIPPDLFKNSREIVNFAGVFRETKITKIPVEIFANCPKVVYFNSVFFGCSQLTEIPENLFANNTMVKNFGGWNQGAFNFCTSLKTIPENLFKNCPEVTNFDCTFNGCTGLQAIPETLFANNVKVTSFSWCFANCVDITGIVPELWKGYPSANGEKCYAFVGKATNYANIPDNWK